MAQSLTLGGMFIYLVGTQFFVAEIAIYCYIEYTAHVILKEIPYNRRQTVGVRYFHIMD